MARIAKGDMHRMFEAMGQVIKDADQGNDGIVSRADMKTEIKNMDAQVEELAKMLKDQWDGGYTEMAKEQHGIRKELLQTFFRFIDHRDAAPGARITAADVDRAVAYAKEHMVDNYDLNNNGLSKAEIANMSKTAQLAVGFMSIANKMAAVGYGARDQVQQLEDMRDDMTNLVNDHQWNDVLAYFPADIVKAQKDLGIGPQQFLIEAMGLNVGDIPEAAGDSSEFSRLNNVRAMWFDDSGAPKKDEHGTLTVHGELHLQDDSKLRFSILVNDDGEGQFNFTSAVG